MTNGDKIRSMTNTELMEIINERVMKCRCCPCYHTDLCPYPVEIDCDKKILTWLNRDEKGE